MKETFCLYSPRCSETGTVASKDINILKLSIQFYKAKNKNKECPTDQREGRECIQKSDDWSAAQVG